MVHNVGHEPARLMGGAGGTDSSRLDLGKPGSSLTGKICSAWEQPGNLPALLSLVSSHE